MNNLVLQPSIDFLNDGCEQFFIRFSQKNKDVV